MKLESEYVLRSAAILAHSALDDASAVNSALQYGGAMPAVKKTAQAANDAIDHVQNLLYILADLEGISL